MRPVLRPGLRPATVDGRAVLTDATTVLPISPAARALVSALDGLRDDEAVQAGAVAAGVTAEEVSAQWCWLLDRHVVIDAAAGTTASELLADPAGDARWAARQSAVVRVYGAGPTAEALVGHFDDAGIGRLDLEPVIDAPGAPSDLVVLAADHEVPLDVLEPLVRADVPHLVGGTRDATGRIGPLVVPGWSACSRCYDLHRRASDPTWRWRRPLLSHPAPDPAGLGVASSRLVAATAALLAHEAVAYVDGRKPRTLSCTLVLREDDLIPEPTALAPHPWCGCVWPEETQNKLPSSATMEA